MHTLDPRRLYAAMTHGQNACPVTILFKIPGEKEETCSLGQGSGEFVFLISSLSFADADATEREARLHPNIIYGRHGFSEPVSPGIVEEPSYVPSPLNAREDCNCSNIYETMLSSCHV